MGATPAAVVIVSGRPAMQGRRASRIGGIVGCPSCRKCVGVSVSLGARWQLGYRVGRTFRFFGGSHLASAIIGERAFPVI